MQYTWNIENILNNTTNEDNKKIIIGENTNNLYKKDKAVVNYAKINPLTYYFINKYNLHFIKKEMPNIYIYLYEYLYQLIDPAIIKDLRFKHEDNINETTLVNFIKNFACFLNDKDIINIIEKITNKDNHLLRMQYDENNIEITKFIHGRVLKDLNNDLIIGSFYIKETMHDFPIFAHEIGHMISGFLFKKDINPLFYQIFREVESYYMELLSTYYLNKECKINDLSNLFKLYRLNTFERDYYYTLIHNAICNHPLRNIDAINNDIKKYNIKIEKNYINGILREEYIEYLNRIISYLIALELYYITIDNIKEGLDLYKRLFTDKEQSLEKLLNKYNLDITNSKNLKKEIKNMQKIIV